ncbi:MAG TPA: ATP-grasp domain-containing protein [Anaerolineae bacterium]|nr:ATP-grasp domain-containing protein [Anaerolineae bacterium]
MDASLGEASLILPAVLGGARARAAVEEGVALHRPLRRVLVAYSAIERTVRGEPRELEAELETIRTAQTIAENLNRARIRAQTYVVYDLSDVDRIASEFDSQTTLVFNLCEHLQGDSHRDGEVAQRMTDLGLRFTGASVGTLANAQNKAHTKEILKAAGVPTARYQVFAQRDDLIRVSLPAIVKPVAEDASIGIDRDSVVRDELSLRRRVEYVLDTYREPALVEEFIDGREFNVGLWGNGRLYMLPIAELDYCDWADPYQRFLHFDAKWNPEALEYRTMYVRCPADIDNALAERIGKTARMAYRVMGCRDYARVDMRLKDGRPMVLEVNPNPCLASDAGFPNAARAAGYDYPQMVARIARWAWARRGKEGAL